MGVCNHKIKFVHFANLFVFKFGSFSKVIVALELILTRSSLEQLLLHQILSKSKFSRIKFANTKPNTHND